MTKLPNQYEARNSDRPTIRPSDPPLRPSAPLAERVHTASTPYYLNLVK